MRAIDLPAPRLWIVVRQTGSYAFVRRLPPSSPHCLSIPREIDDSGHGLVHLARADGRANEAAAREVAPPRAGDQLTGRSRVARSGTLKCTLLRAVGLTFEGMNVASAAAHGG